MHTSLLLLFPCLPLLSHFFLKIIHCTKIRRCILILFFICLFFLAAKNQPLEPESPHGSIFVVEVPVLPGYGLFINGCNAVLLEKYRCELIHKSVLQYNRVGQQHEEGPPFIEPVERVKSIDHIEDLVRVESEQCEESVYCFIEASEL